MNPVNEALEKFKEMLGTIQTVAIRTGVTHDTSKILAGAILHSFFRSQGKKSQFEFSPVTEEIQRVLFSVFKSVENDSLNSRVTVTIERRGKPVSVEYEKTDTQLSIVLESNESLSVRDVNIQEEGARADLLMLIDPKEREIDGLCESIPHREVVKVSPKGRSLSLKVHDIIGSIQPELPRDLATALWLLVRSDHIDENHQTEALVLQKNLESGGIDHEIAQEAFLTLYGKSFWKLTGRALARTEHEQSIKTIWSFLPKKDFERTGQSTKNISRLFYEIKRLRPEGAFHVFLWESPDVSTDGKISALIAAKNNQYLAALAGNMGAELNGHHCLITNLKSFSEAEARIRSSIQRVTS
jgi:hypothetical protein